MEGGGVPFWGTIKVTSTTFMLWLEQTFLPLDTIDNLNNIALDNYCSTLMKVRTQQAEITSIKPYLEHFSSMHLKAYFTSNNTVTPILPITNVH